MHAASNASAVDHSALFCSRSGRTAGYRPQSRVNQNDAGRERSIPMERSDRRLLLSLEAAVAPAGLCYDISTNVHR